MTTAEQLLAALEAQVAELRRAVVFTTALGDAIHDRGYQEGRESILGRQVAPRSLRPRHLSVAGGGRS